jgi:hypothetical protein
VNESPERVGTDYSQEPQNNQNYADCPKHLEPPFIFDDAELCFVAFSNEAGKENGKGYVCLLRDDAGRSYALMRNAAVLYRTQPAFCFPAIKQTNRSEHLV